VHPRSKAGCTFATPDQQPQPFPVHRRTLLVLLAGT
jgi:hypothetical protein